MAPSLLVRVIGVTAIGFGLIIGATSASGTLAQGTPSPASTGQGSAHEITVTLAADGLTSSRTALRAGQPYSFLVTNADSVAHPFVLEQAGTLLSGASSQAAVDDIAPGETQRLDWTFSAPGDYEMTDDSALATQPGLATPFMVVGKETPTVSVKLGDFNVTPGMTELKAGTTYLFEITNAGAATHEFVLEPATAVDEPLSRVANGVKAEAEAEDIAPGQTKDVLWTFPAPGEYQMACHVPGHFEAGMKSVFKVVA
jgi:uncharacterized cupredoxin-like copper-binding protein